MDYKSSFIKKFNPEKKLLKVRKRLDLGYTSFFPGEAVNPEALQIELHRIKMLWGQRYFEDFDPEDDVADLTAKFNKKLRIIKAGEKVLSQKVG